jgi:late competence protein required for DNA uptake (superfamily II DNA/RNA helicase)
MSEEQVANMFGEAARMERLNLFRKKVQDGFVDKLVPSEIEKKTTDHNMTILLNPNSFKTVAKSAAALKSKFHNRSSNIDSRIQARSESV